MTDDDHRALLDALGAVHADLTRLERRVADLPGRVDRFDERLHRARWERPPPRRDLDDRLARLDHRVGRIERRDDRAGPLDDPDCNANPVAAADLADAGVARPRRISDTTSASRLGIADLDTPQPHRHSCPGHLGGGLDG